MAKIKVISAPTQRPPAKGAYADQSGWALDTGGRVFDPTMSIKQPFKPSESMGPVPREFANLEAEKGEVLTRQDQDGGLSKFDIGGKRHSEGGTPLIGEKGDFIFSDFKKLAIGGPILEVFGKNATTSKKYTPADLAKQYDINKYKALLDNPDSDNLTKSTAERMIANFERKLGGLAIIQEAKKGFPQGMPQLMGQNDKGVPQAKYGGYLPKAQLGNNPSVVFTNNQDQSTGFPAGESGNAPYTNWDPEYYNKLDAAPGIAYNPTTKRIKIISSPENETVVPDFIPTPVVPGAIPTTGVIPSNTTEAPWTKGMSPGEAQSMLRNHTSLDDYNRQNNINYTSYNPPYGISRADMINTLANAAVPPHMGTPIRSTPRVSIPGVVLPDERAAIAAAQSAGNAAMQANAITGDGARVRASNTGITGNLLQNLAGIEGSTQGEKAKILNEAQRYAAEAQTKQSFATQEANQMYNAQSDTARQNYDQSLRNYLHATAQDLTQAQRNAAKRYNLNMINAADPYYADNNGKLQWRPGYNASMSGQSTGQQTPDEMYASRLKFYKANGDNQAEASMKAHQDLRDHRARISGSMYNPQAQKYVNTSSPDIQNMNTQYYNQGYNTGMGNWQGLNYND